MRILWLTHRDPFGPNAGGAERTVLALSKALGDRGHMVEIAYGGESALVFRQGGRVFRRFNGNLGPHLASPNLLRETGHWDAVIDDLAHVVPWASNRIAPVRTFPFFRHFHRRTVMGQTGGTAAVALNILERTYPLLYDGCTFITESNTSVSDLCELGVKREFVSRVGPGVDLELFRPGEIGDSVEITYLSGLKQYKRPELAIQTFRLIRSALGAAHLTILGGGPLMPRLREMVDSLGLATAVRFTGRVDDATLADLLRHSWLTLVTSEAEGWGYAATESIASGVPVVACRAPGVEDSVQNGKTGVLVDSGSPEEIAAAALQVLRDVDEWRSRCAVDGRSRGWNKCAADWESTLFA